MICAGIDAGSRTVKAVLLDARTREVLGVEIGDQGVRPAGATAAVYDALLAGCGVRRDDVRFTVATGYARNLVAWADTTITEITCHARGVHHRMPSARTVVEIGGQDSKLLRLQADGTVRDFAMNDRCAAGTGRFLEMVSDKLDVPLARLGAAATESTRPAAISSMCVVFAETEIIGLLASGAAAADVVAGVLRAIASRVAAMAAGRVETPVAFTGGVALVDGTGAALGAALGAEVAVVPDPQTTGALGAALLAARRCAAR